MKRKWESICSFIKVEREVTIRGKLSKEIAYFISDLPPRIGAKYFYEGIRSHWQIETFHYIKDTVFLEDSWKVKKKNAPANYSIIRSMCINIFRQNNLHCIQATIERCANNVPFMRGLL